MDPPGHTKVIAGNGKILVIIGWVTLRLKIAGRVVYHDCGIVKDLPIDFILGGEFMKPHACTLQYAPAGRNEFIVQRTECKYCAQNIN